MNKLSHAFKYYIILCFMSKYFHVSFIQFRARLAALNIWRKFVDTTRKQRGMCASFMFTNANDTSYDMNIFGNSNRAT